MESLAVAGFLPPMTASTGDSDLCVKIPWLARKSPKIAAIFDAFEGPQIGLEEWHQALGNLRYLVPVCVCFIGCCVVMIGCLVALLSPCCFCLHDWIWTFWPDSFPQRVGSLLCYQPKLHALFFRGNPSNLPYIRKIVAGPPVPRFLRRRTARTLSADEARGSTGFHRGQMSDKSMQENR